MMSYCRQVLLCPLTTVILLAVSNFHFTSADVLTCSSTTITINFDYESKVLKYPGSGIYPISVRCRWLFQAKASDFIFFLRFQKPIGIGSETFNIYDGPDASSGKLFDSITSTTTTNYKRSTTNKLFVEFTSDTTSGPSETGFTLEIGNGKDTSGCPTPSTSHTITLSSSPYFLTSPSFPSNYPSNTNCTWTFTTSDQSATIVVRFLYHMFDKFQGKCYDNVKVYEGSTVMQAALIGSQLCDDVVLSTETRNSTVDSITVDFYSDDRVNGEGFSALVYEIGASQSITPEQTTKSDAITTKLSTTTETATLSQSDKTTRPETTTTTQSDSTSTTSQSDTTSTQAGTTSQSDTTTTDAGTTSQSDTTTTEAGTTSQSDTTTTKASTTSQSDTTTTEADTTSQSDTTTTTKASTAAKTTSAVKRTTINAKVNNLPLSDEAVLVLLASSIAFVFLIIIIIGIACCASMSRKRKRGKPVREGEQRLYVSYFGNPHFSPY